MKLNLMILVSILMSSNLANAQFFDPDDELRRHYGESSGDGRTPAERLRHEHQMAEDFARHRQRQSTGIDGEAEMRRQAELGINGTPAERRAANLQDGLLKLRDKNALIRYAADLREAGINIDISRVDEKNLRSHLQTEILRLPPRTIDRALRLGDARLMLIYSGAGQYPGGRKALFSGTTLTHQTGEARLMKSLTDAGARADRVAIGKKILKHFGLGALAFGTMNAFAAEEKVEPSPTIVLRGQEGAPQQNAPTFQGLPRPSGRAD